MGREQQTFKLYRIELTYPEGWEMKIQAAREDFGDIEIIRPATSPGDVFETIVSLSWRPEKKVLPKYSSMEEYKNEVHRKLAKQYKDLQVLNESVMNINGHPTLISEVIFSAGRRRFISAESFRVGRIQAFIRCGESGRLLVFSAIARHQEFRDAVETSRLMLNSIKCH